MQSHDANTDPSSAGYSRDVMDRWAKTQMEEFTGTEQGSLQRNEAVIEVSSAGEFGRGVFMRCPAPRKHKVIVKNAALACRNWRNKMSRYSAYHAWMMLPSADKKELVSSNPTLKGLPCQDGKIPSFYQTYRLNSYVYTHGFRQAIGQDAFIYLLASNINHACRKCANYEWHIEGEQIHVTTRKNLRTGDQLFIRYGAPGKQSFSCGICGGPLRQKIKAFFHDAIAPFKYSLRRILESKSAESDDQGRIPEQQLTHPESGQGQQSRDDGQGGPSQEEQIAEENSALGPQRECTGHLRDSEGATLVESFLHGGYPERVPYSYRHVAYEPPAIESASD